MKFRFLILAVLVLSGVSLLPVAGDETESGRGGEQSAAAPVNATSGPVTDPALVAARYHEVLARPVYRENAQPDLPSRLGEWISQWFTRLVVRFYKFQSMGNMPTVASLLMTILSVLAVGGLLYIVFRLTRRKAQLEIEPQGWLPGARTFRPPESYESEIQEAIRGGDWHGAWLAGWRQFLSRLENRRLVEADRTRTNREYLAQLRGQALPASALTLLTGMVDAYDRFIYGRQSLAEADWNHFHRQIDEAVLLLHLTDAGAAQLQPKAA